MVLPGEMRVAEVHGERMECPWRECPWEAEKVNAGQGLQARIGT
jgi:hypothetical protein